MSSLVQELQRNALDTKKPVADLLRMVKVIAAKLDLKDIGEWVEHELNGYPGGATCPPYRVINGGSLEVFHPMYSWRPVEHINRGLPCNQSVSQLQSLEKAKSLAWPLTGKEKIQLRDEFGTGVNDWQQHLKVDTTAIIGIIDSVRNKILEWSLELEKRGIRGENMSFDETEKKSAQHNITIQNFNGVLGNVTNSHVAVYDYSTINQALKDNNVPRDERNAIEDIMDDLKKAPEAERPKLLDKAKTWIVKNKDFLGAATGLVRKACGLPDAE